MPDSPRGPAQESEPAVATGDAGVQISPAKPGVLTTAEVFGPSKITYYTVQSRDLDALQTASTAETTASAFLFGCGGIFAGGLFGVLSAGDLSPTRMAIYVGLLAAFGLGTAASAVFFWRAIQARGKAADAVRKNAGPPKNYQLADRP